MLPVLKTWPHDTAHNALGNSFSGCCGARYVKEISLHSPCGVQLSINENKIEFQKPGVETFSIKVTDDVYLNFLLRFVK